MIKLSASLIKDYLDCTQRGYYRINEPEQSIQNEYMLAGTLVHEMIEKNLSYTLNDLLSMGYSYTLANRIVSCNLNYVTTILNNDFLSGGVHEHKFDYAYSRNAHIVGKIDWITDNGTIVDWKTSTTTRKNIDNDVQFIIYDDAYRHIFNKPPTAVLCIYLTNGSIVQYNRKQQNIHELYERVIPRILNTIKSNQYSRDGIYTGACFNCPFKEYCLQCQDGM